MSYEQTPPDINEMMANATHCLNGQTLDRPLSPEMVVLATENPRDVYRAIQDGVLGAAVAEIWDRPVTIEAGRARQRALSLDDLSLHLSRRRRLEVQAGAVVVGIALGVFSLISLGKTKYELDSALGINRPSISGHALLKNNTLVADPSIMPGNDGAHWRVIGPVLRRIPGIPDYADIRIPVTKIVKRQVIEKATITAKVTTEEGALNPLSPHLNLTGKEYEPDRKMAAALLDNALKDNLNISRIDVTGLASDDFGNTVGEPNPQQKQLALARAKVAAQAFEDEAASRHVKLPTMPHLHGLEVVLGPQEITQLEALTRKNHYSFTDQLIGAYNSGQKLTAEADSFLHYNLDANRGARIQLHGTRPMIKIVKKTTYIKKPGSKLVSDIPGEVIFGVPALLIGAMGSLIACMPRYGRYIHKRAQRIVRKAGFEV